jgi:hypothetical protein
MADHRTGGVGKFLFIAAIGMLSGWSAVDELPRQLTATRSGPSVSKKQDLTQTSTDAANVGIAGM